MTIRSKLGFNFYDISIYIICSTFAFICFYPMWYVFIGSINPVDSIASAAPLFLPISTPTFKNYAAVLSGPMFQRAFVVSVLKTFISSTGMLILTSMMAYGVSKKHVNGMKFVNLYVIFTMFFGGSIIQYYLLYLNMNLLNTFWVMVLPALTDTWTFIVMRNYFVNNVPSELEDAASIDGANEIVLFFRIVVPISKPVFAALFLFAAVAHWNDWTSFLYYVDNMKLQPFVRLLQKILTDPNIVFMQGGGGAENGQMINRVGFIPPISLRYTTIVCAMLPIMIVYPFLQRYFAKGMMVGAIKE